MSMLGREPVSFGLSLPNRATLFGTPLELLLDCAQMAEDSGAFDSVWVGDNLLSKPRLEAVVLLSALAARTKRVKLGTVCLATFPMRHPLLFALQWASLDVVSGGRTLLVVCNGGSARDGPKFATELAAMGVQSDERMARVEEGIVLLRRLWTEDEVTFEGQFYRMEGVSLLPKPVRPRVPIGLAVNPRPDARAEVVERVLRRVARFADGWQTDGTPPDVFRDRWQRILTYAREYGREQEVTHNSLHLMVNINDDRETAWDEAMTFLDHYYGFGRDLSDSMRERLETWVAYGPPERVIAKIQSYLDAGCTTPILRFCSPDQKGQLARCIDEVLPAFEHVRAASPV
jgi:alkanesulfonate monooxygenase SsuD/methylene tetrahydromethanopterin reductase-like flavin-dependent oxidoreductase (luciferase family)